jgi:hypothetical protein
MLPTLFSDRAATFDPISEGSRPRARETITPTPVLGRLTKRAPLGSMTDTPNVSTPERALMAAVLRAAIKDGDTKWATREDASHVFSIVNVCDVLGLDIDRVRKEFS